jgi:hypothetical protein
MFTIQFRSEFLSIDFLAAASWQVLRNEIIPAIQAEYKVAAEAELAAFQLPITLGIVPNATPETYARRRAIRQSNRGHAEVCGVYRKIVHEAHIVAMKIESEKYCAFVRTASWQELKEALQ